MRALFFLFTYSSYNPQYIINPFLLSKLTKDPYIIYNSNCCNGGNGSKFRLGYDPRRYSSVIAYQNGIRRKCSWETRVQISGSVQEKQRFPAAFSRGNISICIRCWRLFRRDARYERKVGKSHWGTSKEKRRPMLIPKNIFARGSRSATWHNGVLRNATTLLKKLCIVRAEVNNDIKRGTVYENLVDFLHDAPVLSANVTNVVEPIKARLKVLMIRCYGCNI